MSSDLAVLDLRCLWGAGSGIRSVELRMGSAPEMPLWEPCV